jgi:DNA-binding phage protein
MLLMILQLFSQIITDGEGACQNFLHERRAMPHGGHGMTQIAAEGGIISALYDNHDGCV